MIDTLRLRFNNFKVTSLSNLTIAPSTYNAEDGLDDCNYELFNFGDQYYKGSKAFINDIKFNATIVPVKNPKSNIHSFLLYQISIPRINSDYNVSPCRDSLYSQICQSIRSLSKKGIDSDPDDAEVSRLDLFTNIQTAKPLSLYTPLWSSLFLKRMQPYCINANYGWRNKRREFIIYDKIHELNSSPKVPTAYIKSLPSNLIRFEYKRKNKSSVKQDLQVLSLPEVMNDYDKLISNHYSFIKKIASSPISNLNYDFDSVLSQMKIDHPRNFVQHTLKYFGIQHISNQKTFKQFISACRSLGVSRYTSKRLITDFFQFDNHTDLHLHDLQSELIDKIDAEEQKEKLCSL